MNPPLMFTNGQRMRDHSTKDLPPFSARLMPEFDKRRNIKDMFKRHAPNGSQSLLSQPDPAVHDAQLASAIVQSPKKETVQRWSSKDHSQAPNLAKRKASGSTITGPAIKKPKAPSTAPSSSLAKGQRTLQGFFQKRSQPLQPEEPHCTSPIHRETTPPKHPPSPLSRSPSVVMSQDRAPSILSSPANLKTKHSIFPTVKNDASEIADAQDRLNTTSSPQAPVHDPIVAKEGWTKLFTKKEPPRCEEHAEPCTLFQTKKKGINSGRSFWICARYVNLSHLMPLFCLFSSSTFFIFAYSCHDQE